MLDSLDLVQGGGGSFSIDHGGDDLIALGHCLVIGNLILSGLFRFPGRYGVVFLEQLGQEIVGHTGGQLGNRINAVDTTGTLGEVSLAVGEADRPLSTAHFHKAAQVHNLPHGVLGGTLGLDAELGIVAVLFLDGVEHDNDVLIQNIDDVIEEPLELLAQPTVALEGQAAITLAVLGLDALAVLTHDGQQLAAGINDDGLEVGEVLFYHLQLGFVTADAQVLAELLVVTGLGDACRQVEHFAVDTLSGKVDVDVKGLGGGQRQGGLADAGEAGNQDADFLIRKSQAFGFYDHRVVSPFSYKPFL